MPIELPVVDTCFMCGLVEEMHSHPWVWASDELTITALNGRQFEVGQSLVIPRRHAATLKDLGTDELLAVMQAAQRAAAALVDAFDPDGVLLYQNNGVGSGQEVPHFHLHVVPRQPGSDWGFGPPHLAELDRRAGSRKFDYTQDTPDKQVTAERLRAAVVNA